MTTSSSHPAVAALRIARRAGGRAATIIAICASCAGAVDLATLPVDTWVETHPTYAGAPPGGTLNPQAWDNKGVYDPASQRVIVFDRWVDAVHGASIYANTLLAFDPVTEVVTLLKIDNWKALTDNVMIDGVWHGTVPLAEYATDPTPVDRHPLGCLALVPEVQKVYLTNGLNQGAAYGGLYGNAISDTWAFDLTRGTWSRVSSETSVPPNPAAGSGQVMCYDRGAGLIAYFWPKSSGEGTLVWLLDPITGHWRQVSDVPAGPRWVNGSGTAYDSKRGRIVVFGSGWDATGASPQLWAYGVSEDRWTRLADCPAAVAAPGFDYDSNHDVFLALDGEDTWIYDPTSDAWTAIAAPMTRIVDMRAQPVTYDAAHDVFVFEGGNEGYAPAQWMVFRYAGAAAAPTITHQPHDARVSAGGAAVFTVLAAGSPAPSYRWQRRAPGAAGFADLPGAVAATCTFAGAAGADSGASFRCVVANAHGSAISDSATLTVDGAATATAGGSAAGSATGGATAGSTASGSTGATGPSPGADGGGSHRCGFGVGAAALGLALLSLALHARAARPTN